MKIPSTLLVLATSGPDGEIGLQTHDGAFRALTLGQGAARGRGLQPAVDRILGEAGLRAGSLEGIVVDRGPGSFTGVRVGVTVAKSLAFALQVPVLPVTSLAALASQGDPASAVLALRDAGRTGFYAGLFGPEAGGARSPSRDLWRAPLADVLAEAPDAEILIEDASIGVGRLVRAGAAAILEAARPQLARGDSTPAHVVAPLYLQASAPERRLAGEGDGAMGSVASDRT